MIPNQAALMDINEKPRETCHVTFELRPFKDATKSQAEGHAVYKDVEYAILTPPGGQLVVPKPVTPELIDRFRPQYDAWKRDEELPENGTHIKMWPVATPAEIKQLLSAKIRTIEAVAEMNEICIKQVGMGARALKDKAIAWLDSAKLSGITAEKLQGLQVENDDLRIQNEQLIARNEELKVQLTKERRENKTIDIGDLQDENATLKIENAELHGKLKPAPKKRKAAKKRKR
jgi:regulator of replication initiation timing